MRRVTRATAIVLIAVAVVGCGKGRKKLYPTRGELFVGGKPAHEAVVYLHPTENANGPDSSHPLATVDETGAFKFSTYETGDGVPEGDYVITFEWRERSGFLKQNFDGPDRLKGKYYDVGQSTYRVTIKKGENVIPRIEVPLP